MRVLRLVLLWTVAVASGLVDANLISEIQNEFAAGVDCDAAAFRVVTERGLDFKAKAASLARGNVHMSTLLLSKKGFDQGYREFDPDGYTDQLSHSSDRILLSKSATVFIGVSPEFFTAERSISRDYLRAAMGGKIKVLDQANGFAIRKRDVYGGFKSVTATVHFEAFSPASLATEDSSNYGRIVEFLGERSELGVPDYVNTNFSSGQEISAYSYGRRTFDLYYRVDDNATLQISYRLVTIKYSRLLYVLWGAILKEFPKELVKMTGRSVRKIRRYLPHAGS